MMIQTPDSLRVVINVHYPPFNSQIFEEFFYSKYLQNQIETERIYLPIFWTSLYVNRNYGNGDLSDIQNFIDNLDKDKKYYTIVQYDDNILNNFGDLDIKIFAMGGHGKYSDKCYPIPLNCLPPPNIFINPDKDIFASFIGSDTHPVRVAMRNSLGGDSKYFISQPIGYEQFRDVMSRSIFSLCPRGYGETSFRICEALQNESIPVYIYDNPLVPFNTEFNFDEIGVQIHVNDISKLDEILSSKTPEDINRYVERGREIYKKYFDYDGCFNSIIEILQKNN
jgi:hypothetical protein